MFQDYFAQSELLIWPLIGLIIFLASFVGVLLYVGFGLRDRRKLEHLSRLPLQSDSLATETESVRRKS